MTVAESNSVEIIREALACARNPVVLVSGGKESSVLVHLIRKACFPVPLRIPMLHIDTGWEFPETLEQVLLIGRTVGAEPLVHKGGSRRAREADPFTQGREVFRRIVKSEPLADALGHHGFDVVLGGGRPREVGARIDNAVLVFQPGHRFDHRAQRLTFWGVSDCRVIIGETARVFPLCNWSELDVWRYVFAEGIRVNPLYFAACRRVFRHRDHWIVLPPGLVVPEAKSLGAETRWVRLRHVGCWPFSDAITSSAASIADLVAELDELAAGQGGSSTYVGNTESVGPASRVGYF